ncbi:hypothetical protein WJX72_008997 [[Myrmecia] bisecta]|uniref:Uncharacterized protein n=1 Tax=[Myrmecia] bisecta TaxID=41462 RepID=A0AAW1Q7I2_9CHLO
MGAPEIQVKRLHVEPNNCPLDSPLTLTLEFSCAQDLQNVTWEVQYVVDMTAKRHVLQLGSTPSTTYPAGETKLEFKVDQINTEGVKNSWLNNVGLLLVVLRDAAEMELFQLSMVTQIEKRDGHFFRNMLSPLE